MQQNGTEHTANVSGRLSLRRLFSRWRFWYFFKENICRPKKIFAKNTSTFTTAKTAPRGFFEF
jgi:hypothetical protein